MVAPEADLDFVSGLGHTTKRKRKPRGQTRN